MAKTRRLLIFGIESAYLREVVTGANAYCCAHGSWEFHLEWIRGERDADTFTRARQALRQWKADGIIAHVRNHSVEASIRHTGLPAVNIGNSAEVSMPTVMADNVATGRLAARHFLESGLEHFGFCGLTDEFFAQHRCRGFCAENAKAGFETDILDDRIEGEGDGNWESNRQRTSQWLRSLKKPAGVLCVRETRAMEVISICRRLGLRVPDDIAVIAVGNDLFYCRLCSPPLSSIAVNFQQIGYEAAALVDALIRGKPAPKKPILIGPHRVVVRQSSDIIAVADADVAAAMRYIRTHAHRPFNVKALLREIPVSRRMLEQRFKKFIGRTPREEITRVRMDLAKNDLAETNLPIPTVARNAGFIGREIFAACFRRETGMTPSQYRRQFQAGLGVPRFLHSSEEEEDE